MITAIPRLDELFEVQKTKKKADKGTIEVDGVDYKLPELLEKEGVECVHQILLKAMMNIYQENGIEIEPKHFELIIRQMLNQVEITDAGDTNLYAGQKVSRSRLAEENAQVTAKNGQPAECKPLICGVTEIALSSDSFLSAAAFQQTTNVLTQAALRGATDPLRGMRGCVIAGRLIPAGTGFE